MKTTPDSSTSRIALEVAMLLDTNRTFEGNEIVSKLASDLRAVATPVPSTEHKPQQHLSFPLVAESIQYIDEAGRRTLLARLNPESAILNADGDTISLVTAALASEISREFAVESQIQSSARIRTNIYRATLRSTVIWSIVLILPFIVFVSIRGIEKDDAASYSPQPAQSEEAAEVQTPKDSDSDTTDQPMTRQEIVAAITEGLEAGFAVFQQHEKELSTNPVKQQGKKETQQSTLPKATPTIPKPVTDEVVKQTKTPAASDATDDGREEKSDTGDLATQTSANQPNPPHEMKIWALLNNEHSNLFISIARIALLSLVAVSGAWGGFLGFHLRYRAGAKFDEAASLPITCPLMGALFGFIVFLLLASGLVEGRIFPTSEQSEWQAMLFVPGAMFCLVLWCLIGGFAQDRIVGVLNSLSKDLEKQATSEAKPSILP